MSPPIINPLSTLNDVELWNAQLMIAIACNKQHVPLAKKREQWFCGLGRVLKIESDQRGVPHPVIPYSVSKLKPEAL